MSDKRKCPSHQVELVERPKTRQTGEQLWCGKWFDCPYPRCGNSSLKPSGNLTAFLTKQIESLKADYLTLKGKRQRERFLKGCAPWVVEACLSESL